MKRLAPLLLALAACNEIDTDATTSPYAHESAPLPPAPLQTLSRATYLGGSNLDVIDDVVKGGNDLVFAVGGTASVDFPFTDGSSPDTSAPAGCSLCPFDGFAAALDPDGTLRWATRIASPGYDRLVAAVVIGNQLFVAGSSGERPGLTGWHGGADPAGERGDQDGIVCVLEAATGVLQGCQYLGGTGATGVTDLHSTSPGNALTAVMISPAGENLHLDPQYSGAFAGRYRSTPPGGDDVVVFTFSSALTPFGNGNGWATYVGGSGDERGTPAITNHFGGSGVEPMTVLTETTSTDADTPRGAFTVAPAEPDGGHHAYLAQLSGDGMQLQYGTYIGGNGDERVSPGTLLDNGNGAGGVIVGLTTTSTDLRTSAFAAQPEHGGNGGAGCGDGDGWVGLFVTSMSGAPSLWGSTYLGGSQGEHLAGVSLSHTQFSGAVMVTGTTASSNFPVWNGAQPGITAPLCTAMPGAADVFITNLDLDFNVIDSTYLGGSGVDLGAAVHRGFDDRAVVGGSTTSVNFPVRGLGDGVANGGQDGFIAEYGQLPIIPPPPGPDAGLGGDGGDVVNPPGPYEEDGAFCVCGASRSPAAGVAPTLLVCGALLMRRKRRRRSS